MNKNQINNLINKYDTERFECELYIETWGTSEPKDIVDENKGMIIAYDEIIKDLKELINNEYMEASNQ